MPGDNTVVVEVKLPVDLTKLLLSNSARFSGEELLKLGLFDGVIDLLDVFHPLSRVAVSKCVLEGQV